MRLKRVFLSLCIGLFVVCAVIGIALGASSNGVMTAQAATTTTQKYLTYGKTTTDDSSSYGCPSNFKIYMYGSNVSGSGTMYQDKIIDWSYVYIKIEVSELSEHQTFKLKRNGSNVVSTTMNGNASTTLYSGSLSDGKYEFEYTGRYRKNIFYAYTNFTYTYRFEIDKTSPTYSLQAGGLNISSGTYTNQQIVYTMYDKHPDAIYFMSPSDSSYRVTYSSSFTVSATTANNGWWYFYCRDYNGATSATSIVYLDTVAPTGKIVAGGATVANGASINKSFYYTATDLGGISYMQYKTPGSSTWKTYNGETLVGTNGTFTFRAADNAGNISEETKVTYDAGTPSTTLYSGTTTVFSGAYSKASYIKFVASDSVSGIYETYVKMPNTSNYVTYTNGSQLTNEGTYSFYAKDKAGNTTPYYTITLDKSKPYGSLNAGTGVVSSGSFTKASYIKFIPYDTISGVSSTYVMKPDSSGYVTYSSGTQLTAEGTYKFYSLDRAGNQSDIYTITIDRSSPSAQLYADDKPISSGAYTNAGKIKFVVSDSSSGVASVYVKMPNASKYTAYISGSQLTDEGTYSFYAEDKVGNMTTTYSVTLDKSKPFGTLKAEANEIASGSATNAKYIQFIPTDTVSGISATYILKPNATGYVSYASGTQLTEVGTYKFYTVDRAGNQSDVYTLIIDHTTPSVQLYAGDKAVSSGCFTNANNVKFTAADSSGIASVFVKLPKGAAYINYTAGSQLTDEGMYSFYAIDKAGNVSPIYTITLDKTKPTGTLYAGTKAVSNGTFTNANYIKFVSADAVSGVSATYVMKPNDSTYVVYTSGTQFLTEGTYKFYAVDKAGNQSDVYTITIDRNAPSAQLYVDDRPVSNGTYTNGVHIKFSSADTNIRDRYVKLPNIDEFISYAEGTEYYKVGKYEFYAVDAAGLTTGVYTIVIDRTVKPLTLNNVVDGKTDGNVTVTWTNGNPNVYAPIASVTVNGKPYVNGSIIRTIDTGKYKVVCVDAAGNEWSAEFESTAINIKTQTLQKEYWEAIDVEGNSFSFENYENALAFACANERTFVRTGIWQNETWDTGIAMDDKDSVNAQNGTYFIYKKSGSENEEIAYFTQERLDEVISEYAKELISSFYYWQKAPAEYGEAQNLFQYSDTKTILAKSIEVFDGVTFTVDGEVVNGLIYENVGKHELVVSDAYGNECVYSLIVVRDIPTIEYTVGEGVRNTVVFDREYRLHDVVGVSILDELDEMAMFSIFDEDGGLLAHLTVGETYTLNESGQYVVHAVNHFGQTQDFVVYLSFDDPKIEGVADKSDKQLVIDVTDSTDKYSSLQALRIIKSTDNGETWEELLTDDYGTTISADTLTYRFRTTGIFKVTLTDEFRTGIDAIVKEFDYIQPMPEGVIEGVEDNGYTNTDVTFTWTDEAIVTLTKDGNEIDYKSGSRLIEDGVYELAFENFDGYKKVIRFVIDKTAPQVDIVGCKNGEIVNNDVAVSINETDLDIKFYKDGNLFDGVGRSSILSDDASYCIVAIDKANNVKTITFGIDKHVDFTTTVADKLLANKVSFSANENLTIVLTNNGETVDYNFDSNISEAGNYTATLTDELGNSVELSFTIVDSLVRRFAHDFSDIEGFEKVFVNDIEMRLTDNVLVLNESGTYNVSVVVFGADYNFIVNVDSTAPTAVLTGVENEGQTKGSVIVDDLSEASEVKVFLNGEEIEYKLGDELTEVGEYIVALTDECGNHTEYSFKILYTMNATAIVLTVIGIVLVIAVVVTVVVLRKKGVFKKGKAAKKK